MVSADSAETTHTASEATSVRAGVANESRAGVRLQATAQAVRFVERTFAKIVRVMAIVWRVTANGTGVTTAGALTRAALTRTVLRASDASMVSARPRQRQRSALSTPSTSTSTPQRFGRTSGDR